ncbi:MAG: choline dehydrogenase [Hyphomicrobiales bacterium]|nr:choline dehydrogenase [Hyphomicrobiales bacterium]
MTHPSHRRHRSSSQLVGEFDYVIIGAGSAGCVLARRLVDSGCTVCLLEAGPRDRSIWIHLPIGYGKTMWHPRFNWRFETEPDPGMNGRRIYWPRGKTLGGSSAINGLIYIRGQREDYDGWAAAGNPGWSFSEVLPYFVKSENNERGPDNLHGASGPLFVSDIGAENELIEALIGGASELGIPRNPDFNGVTQEGAGYYQLNTRRGLRCSTAVGYLRPIRRDPKLSIRTNALASRILFEERRAKGVAYFQGGTERQVRARREVLLAAGAIQSPQLLQLSGIGPAELLADKGVPILQASREVGENLQDHLQFRLIYRCTKPITTNDELRSLLGRARIGLQWVLSRSGPLAVGINQGGIFARALPESPRPDVQFHCATLSADMAGGKVHPFSGFTLSVCQLRPQSRGFVRLRSRDPAEPPAMQPHYLSTPLDRRTAIAAIKLARSLAATPKMRSYVAQEMKPGPGIVTDDELLGFARDTGATIFHPSGTCRMGSDPDAVVDPRLRVKGVEALRVVDASIMPSLVSGNTNAGVVMIAEKASDMILEEAR